MHDANAMPFDIEQVKSQPRSEKKRDKKKNDLLKGKK